MENENDSHQLAASKEFESKWKEENLSWVSWPKEMTRFKYVAQGFWNGTVDNRLALNKVFFNTKRFLRLLLIVIFRIGLVSSVLQNKGVTLSKFE